METWLLAILSLISGGVGTQTIKWLFERWRLKNEKAAYFTKVFTGVSRIYERMNLVIAETQVNRFLILKTENGGGIPKIGSQLYASVIHESYDKPINSVKDKYQRVLIDEDYIKMLVEAEQYGYSTQIVKNMPEDSLLKRFYEAEKVTISEIHYLHQDDNAFYYCSVASTETNEFISSPTRTAIAIAVNDIRNIFKAGLK